MCRIFLFLLVILRATDAVAAANAANGNAIPHLGEQGRADYLLFLQSPPHRAFAIAPGGAWAWVSEASSEEAAVSGALAQCQKHSEQTCVRYAADERVVFDAGAWPTLWRLHATRAAAVGKKRGMRFPDLAFASEKGQPLKLSDWRGKVTVVHFWGSWCAPCKRELPDLQKLVTQFRDGSGVAFVFLPVRESVTDARRWLASQRLALPLYDAGAKSSEDEFLKLAGGGRIRDRDLARVFPTTYVLDRHGIVLFSHEGPVSDWGQYAPFLRDAAAMPGK